MSVEGKFLVYCLEIYKATKNLTGKEVIDMFKHYGITEYILSCYEALHTTGMIYIIEDIDSFVEEQQLV
jgi:hypothetical protein